MEKESLIVPLLKDHISIPERVHQGDFVLQLSKRVTEIKNKLVSANLRLVVSVARKHLQPGLSLMELISEGNMVLMRAVESFNVHRNTRFSTYATFALMKGYARIVPTLRSASISRGQAGLERMADQHSGADLDAVFAREEISRLLGQLSASERSVIAAQFGLRESRTDVGSNEDSILTKQRRRTIERTALKRLREIVGREIVDVNF